MPPDPLHREDNGVWLTIVDAFCTALKEEFPGKRTKKARGPDGVAEEESHSDKIDEVNERLSTLAIEGRWESFNIPCQGEYLPEHPDVQVSPRTRARKALPAAGCTADEARRAPLCSPASEVRSQHGLSPRPDLAGG
jgi:hypothetical protein